MIELAVLDMAGTTVEEHQLVYRALGEAATAAGSAAGPEEIQRWHGAVKREALRHLLAAPDGTPPADDVVNAAVDDFRARLSAAYERTPPEPIPGVVPAFARLRRNGVRVALTTGFDREVTDKLLATLGWESGVVDAVVCGDDVPRGRPAPHMIHRAMELTGVHDVAATLVAGDTPRDLQAGKNSGAAMVIGVLSGAGTVGELGQARHTHLVGSVADLPELLGLPK